ncbi:N-alpha-acetyltransferase 16, NatA auxiliary subunit, partial [Nowakowskiella sp. JEL0078]
TLAMKGLFLSNLDKKEEAYEFIKKGLKNDLTSHICWHVYGLLYRADKNYEEAVKCYTHALKYDKFTKAIVLLFQENSQIIRDLSLLQIQMRNYDGFVETRQRLLNLKPNHRPFWIGLAVAFHLQGQYESAEKVLSAYETTLAEEEQSPTSKFEQSEMLMYKNIVIEERGDFERALEHLEQIKQFVVDGIAWKEARARIQLKLKNYLSAETVYRSLIAINPDCKKYLNGLLSSLQLSGEPQSLTPKQIKQVLEVFDELAEQYPRAHAIKRIPLYYTGLEVSDTHDDFKKRIDEILKEGFRKGVPSLFVSVRDLYSIRWKAEVIEELVESYRKNLVETSGLDNGSIEPPTTLLWVNLFLSQNYDLKGNHIKALELVNEVIDHSPTLVEPRMVQARIYKHAGDFNAASKSMTLAREMDLQDRYVNSKATKYLLRNDEIKEAEKTIVLFGR